MQNILNGIWSQASPEVKESYGDKYFESCKFFLHPHRESMATSLPGNKVLSIGLHASYKARWTGCYPFCLAQAIGSP